MRPDGTYDTNEHRNILTLLRNISTLDAFMFKGIKEAPAIGGENDVDLYDLTNRPDKAALKEKKEAAAQRSPLNVRRGFTKNKTRDSIGSD